MTAAAGWGLLAAVLIVTGGRAGRARLHSLDAPRSTPPGGPPPTVRPAWVGVGIAALTAAAWAAGGVGPAAAVAALAGIGGGVWLRRTGRGAGGDDDAELAARWPLLAVCLEAGLPVAAAVQAVAPRDGPSGNALRCVAGLLELGDDPARAWATAGTLPSLATFARAAGRSAGTGAALAQVARSEGDRLRAALADTAEARAQRAAVLIAGPLGLCFLPAFLVLGIAPVVIGLAVQALARW